MSQRKSSRLIEQIATRAIAGGALLGTAIAIGDAPVASARVPGSLPPIDLLRSGIGSRATPIGGVGQRTRRHPALRRAMMDADARSFAGS